MVYQYKKQSINNDAFTLIEILVVITIFGLLILVGLSNFDKSIDQIRLQMTVESISSNLRFDQTYIKSGAYETDNVVLCKGSKFNNEGVLPVSVNYINGACDMTSLTEGTIIPYNTGVELESIVFDFDSDFDSEEIIVLFTPPEAKISFYNEDSNIDFIQVDAAQVTLTFDYNLSDYSKQRELMINRSGKIQY